MTEIEHPTNKDLEDRLETVEGNVEELAGAVIGPQQSRLKGGGRDEEAGLIAKVDELIETLQNGGLKIKLPVSVWVAIVAALGGLAAQLIATFG